MNPNTRPLTTCDRRISSIAVGLQTRPSPSPLERAHVAADLFPCAERLRGFGLGGRRQLQHVEIVPLVGDVFLDANDHRWTDQLVVPLTIESRKAAVDVTPLLQGRHD